MIRQVTPPFSSVFLLLLYQIPKTKLPFTMLKMNIYAKKKKKAHLLLQCINTLLQMYCQDFTLAQIFWTRIHGSISVWKLNKNSMLTLTCQSVGDLKSYEVFLQKWKRDMTYFRWISKSSSISWMIFTKTVWGGGREPSLGVFLSPCALTPTGALLERIAGATFSCRRRRHSEQVELSCVWRGTALRIASARLISWATVLGKLAVLNAEAFFSVGAELTRVGWLGSLLGPATGARGAGARFWGWGTGAGGRGRGLGGRREARRLSSCAKSFFSLSISSACGDE